MSDAEQIKALKSRIAELEKLIQQEKDKYEWDLKATEEANQKTVRQLEEEIDSSKKKKQTLESNDTERDIKVNQLQGELAQVKIASSQMMEQLDRESERVKSDIEEAKEKNRIAENEIDELKREMALTKNELDTTKTQRDELVVKVSSLRKRAEEFESVDSEVTELGEELQALNQEQPTVEFSIATTQKMDELLHRSEIDTEIVTAQTALIKQVKKLSNVSTWLKVGGVICVVGVVLGILAGLMSRQTPKEILVPTNINAIEEDAKPAETEPAETEPVEQYEESKPKQANVQENDAQVVQVLENNSRLIKKAQTLIRKKKYKQAVKLLGRYIKKHPEDAKLRFIQGIALYRSRKLSASIYQLKKAIELDPKIAEAYYRLGYIYFETKQRKKACQALKRYISLDPSKRRSLRVKKVLRKQRCM